MQDPTSNLDPTTAHALALLGPVFFVVFLVLLAIYIIPIWQIVKKAGFHPALSLLVFVPVVNLVMLYVFAFSRWKVVPAPEYAAAYPGPYPPQAPPAPYPAPYAQQVPMTPAANNYTAPGAYAPVPPAAPSSEPTYRPPTEPPTSL